MSIKPAILGCLGIIAAAVIGFIFFSSYKDVVRPTDNFKMLAEVSSVVGEPENQPADVKKEVVAVEEKSVSIIKTAPVKEVAKEPVKSVLVVETKKPEVMPTKECTYQTNAFPNYKNVILNEIAWMGTPASANNEWIELKNLNATPFDISGWWVIDKAEQIKVQIPSGSLIPAGGFFILERSEDALPSKAGVVYTGALSNENEGLRLFDKDCWLIDAVVAEPEWPAGESTSHKTMERSSNFDWHTSVAVGGTPGAENSIPPVVVVPEPTPPASQSEPSFTPPVIPPAQSGLNHIVISRVQITGGPGRSEEDYVELYNPGAVDFNLNGYRLVKRTQSATSTDTSLKSWTDDALIPAGGVYRWANTAYPGSADIKMSGTIAPNNGVAVRQGALNTGTVVDAVGWGGASNALVEATPFPINPDANQVLMRKNNQDTDNNSVDFEIR